MPRTLNETSQFRSDEKRIKRSGRFEWEQIRAVVKSLMNDRALHERHRDHKLSGEYEGVRECHVAPDWLLIDDKDGDDTLAALTLIRTGSHSELS